VGICVTEEVGRFVSGMKPGTGKSVLLVSVNLPLD